MKGANMTQEIMKTIVLVLIVLAALALANVIRIYLLEIIERKQVEKVLEEEKSKEELARLEEKHKEELARLEENQNEKLRTLAKFKMMVRVNDSDLILGKITEEQHQKNLEEINKLVDDYENNKNSGLDY